MRTYALRQICDAGNCSVDNSTALDVLLIAQDLNQPLPNLQTQVTIVPMEPDLAPEEASLGLQRLRPVFTAPGALAVGTLTGGSNASRCALPAVAPRVSTAGLHGQDQALCQSTSQSHQPESGARFQHVHKGSFTTAAAAGLDLPDGQSAAAHHAHTAVESTCNAASAL